MKIIDFLKAHQLIEKTAQSAHLVLSDQTRSRIIKLSGRLDTWLPPLTLLFGKNPKTTVSQALKNLESHNLLQPVFNWIPSSQHLFLLSPANTPKSTWLTTNQVVHHRQLFSPLFTMWLKRYSTLESHLLTHTPLTNAESKLVSHLYQHKGVLATRDELAATLWGDHWYNSYSDWTLDTHLHHLRQKLLPYWRLVTIRNRGYLLQKTHSRANSQITQSTSSPISPPPGVLPTAGYLTYMNNPANPRKVYSDLFSALNTRHLTLAKNIQKILAINSYSFDNVDTLAKVFPQAHCYFTNFDERALKIHQTRIDELSLHNYHTLYDDIRTTRLQTNSFDLIINDFRLNWNTSYSQDISTMINLFNLLKTQGTLLLSVVVDARYESDRYGQNQEKAPLNIHKPWHFQAQERLLRYCHTIPYYQKLFQTTHFHLLKQFDIEEGKSWAQGATMTNPTTRPSYRRFILTK